MTKFTGTLVITGGGGYVGGNIVRYALEKGYAIRLTARSQSSADKAAALHPQYVNTPQLTTAIVPDITDVSSYESVFDGEVTGVIHSASPFTLQPKDNIKDLLEPAIKGSTAILEAVKRWGSNVRRIVSTSSFASIVDVGKGKREGYTYSEADWNPMSYEEASEADGVTAYCASKALAEKAMWDWIEANKADVHFSLTTICPPWVFGPYVNELTSTKHLSESVGLLAGIIDSDAIPPFDFGGCADSRDLATAHVRALEVSEAGGQRFLVGHTFRYQTAVDIARENFPELKPRLPEGQPAYVEPAYIIDGSKASKLLGVQYTNLAETVKATYGQILHAKQVEGTA